MSGCYYQERNIENLKQYIEEDGIYKLYKNKPNAIFTDFEKFCIEHCKDIENILKEREQDEARIKELQFECEKWKVLATQRISENKANSIKIESQVVPKYEIIDKINELKETLSHYDEYQKLNFLEKVNIGIIDAEIQVLEKLLESKGE